MDVQRSFQRSTFQSVADIVLETAVGSNIVLTDIDRRFAQLQIFRGEGEELFLDIHIRHILHFQFHIGQTDGSGSAIEIQ